MTGLFLHPVPLDDKEENKKEKQSGSWENNFTAKKWYVLAVRRAGSM